MKTITLPFETIIKYDEDENTIPKCPVCSKKTFKVVLTKNGIITMICNNDEFYLTRYVDLTFKANYNVFYGMSLDNMKKQVKELLGLFDNVLISYEVLTEALRHTSIKIQKVV